MRATSVDVCASICEADSRCQGFSFVNAGVIEEACVVMKQTDDAQLTNLTNPLSTSGYPCAARCVDHDDEINRALNVSWGCQGLMLHVQSLYRDGTAANAWPCNQFLNAVHRTNGIRTEAYCPLSCEI